MHGGMARRAQQIGYTRSPLEDSRLFRPSPWKILAATNEKDMSEQPSPWRKSSKESCYGDRVYASEHLCKSDSRKKTINKQ